MDEEISDFHIELLSNISKKLRRLNIEVLEKYDGEIIRDDEHISNIFNCKLISSLACEKNNKDALEVAEIFVCSLKKPSKIFFLKNPNCISYQYMNIESCNIKYRYTEERGVLLWAVSFRFLKFDEHGKLISFEPKLSFTLIGT